MHWAAIRGNLEACTVLVQAGKKEDLIITDNTGLTPAQLAAEKNQRQVSFFLVGDNTDTFFSYTVYLMLVVAATYSYIL